MSYQKRFLEAFAMADRPPREALAKAAGISVQAVGQLLTGKTKALKTEQSARAADYLKVDHFWLATGEGKPRPDRAWPFELFDRGDYELIPAEYVTRIENELAGEIQRIKKRPNGASA